jgi:hypothetical protein
MADKKKPSSSDDSIQGFTKDDPEYWALMARSLGNPVPEYEDDSEYVDENGVVIKTTDDK